MANNYKDLENALNELSQDKQSRDYNIAGILEGILTDNQTSADEKALELAKTIRQEYQLKPNTN